MTLYEIDCQIEALLSQVEVDEETGEIKATPDLEALEALQMERDKKLENVACFIKNAAADVKALKDEAEKLTQRRWVLENRIEGAKAWLASVLDGENFTTPRAAIAWRKTTSVEVDMGQIPEAYKKYAEPTADKVAIKAAIKAGETVPGAQLVESKSMTIK